MKLSMHAQKQKFRARNVFGSFKQPTPGAHLLPTFESYNVENSGSFDFIFGKQPTTLRAQNYGQHSG